MTVKNLKKSRGKSAIPATLVAQSGGFMKPKEKSFPSKLSFRALNRIYVIEEDPMDILDSGLSADVEKALKESKLFIPDAYSSFAEKFPCTGIIVSKGEETKYADLKVGARVMFARLGVQRYKVNGKSYCNCQEDELHAIIH